MLHIHTYGRVWTRECVYMKFYFKTKQRNLIKKRSTPSSLCNCLNEYLYEKNAVFAEKLNLNQTKTRTT